MKLHRQSLFHIWCLPATSQVKKFNTNSLFLQIGYIETCKTSQTISQKTSNLNKCDFSQQQYMLDGFLNDTGEAPSGTVLYLTLLSGVFKFQEPLGSTLCALACLCKFLTAISVLHILDLKACRPVRHPFLILFYFVCVCSLFHFTILNFVALLFCR